MAESRTNENSSPPRTGSAVQLPNLARNGHYTFTLTMQDLNCQCSSLALWSQTSGDVFRNFIRAQPYQSQISFSFCKPHAPHSLFS